MQNNNDAHKNFYTELTLRNHGFISALTQQSIQQSHILIAGCGSTGGSAIELLIRSGAENLTFVDNGTYELNNANRQNMTTDDIGKLKADVHKSRALSINPFCTIDVHNNGINGDNVDELVRRSAVIVDGVDVTTQSGLLAKYLLHVKAQEFRIPVISGYDMSTAQYISVHDYRKADEPLMLGRLQLQDITGMDPLLACAKLIPAHCLPADILDELERHEQEGKDFVSQLGIAANLFGLLSVTLLIDILSGIDVKQEIYVDARELVRPADSEQQKLALQQRQQEFLSRLEQLSVLAA
jgi:hypothetical protein